MNEKRSPHYSLVLIKAAFASPATLNRTFAAAEGAETLCLDDVDVIAVVQSLTMSDFDKSMTSHADSKVWQDVYKPTHEGTRLYVKFTLNSLKDLLLISFKKA